MKNKKLVSTLLVAGTIALLPAIAQARGHHGTRHGARGPMHRVHAASGHHQARHGARFARHHGRSFAGGGGRPSAWCGWWLGNHLGIGDRKLWLARNWASVGQNAGQPGVGVVVVWRHHVGIITGRSGDGWVIKSGNDGHTVRERVRSIAGAIAFRRLG
jgi:hypothetical protein